MADRNHDRAVVAMRVDRIDAHAVAGNFKISGSDGYARILYICPCGCGNWKDLAIFAHGTPKPPIVAWRWDGNCDAPTLDPSIRDLSHCKWHGHLTAGAFVPCSDSGR